MLFLMLCHAILFPTIRVGSLWALTNRDVSTLAADVIGSVRSRLIRVGWLGLFAFQPEGVNETRRIAVNICVEVDATFEVIRILAEEATYVGLVVSGPNKISLLGIVCSCKSVFSTACRTSSQRYCALNASLCQ